VLGFDAVVALAELAQELAAALSSAALGFDTAILKREPQVRRRSGGD
jgi:hypothetical protein